MRATHIRCQTLSCRSTDSARGESPGGGPYTVAAARPTSTTSTIGTTTESSLSSARISKESKESKEGGASPVIGRPRSSSQPMPPSTDSPGTFAPRSMPRKWVDTSKSVKKPETNKAVLRFGLFRDALALEPGIMGVRVSLCLFFCTFQPSLDLTFSL